MKIYDVHPINFFFSLIKELYLRNISVYSIIFIYFLKYMSIYLWQSVMEIIALNMYNKKMLGTTLIDGIIDISISIIICNLPINVSCGLMYCSVDFPSNHLINLLHQKKKKKSHLIHL